MTRVALHMCLKRDAQGFSDPRVVRSCVSVLADVLRNSDCVALAYCFMPDHLHLVLEGRSERADVLGVAARFKQKTGYWFASSAPHVMWQKDFYDTILRNDEDAWERIRYVLNNPVRWGLVEHWWRYPASGCVGVSLEEVVGDVPQDSRLNQYLDEARRPTPPATAAS